MNMFEIETGVRLPDPSVEVDVLLRPRAPFIGPVAISCKAWRDKVGVEHVREWIAVVDALGASSGVIVSENGFTRPAIDWSTPADRRVTLWTPRRLTLDDFAPDEKSPDGYIASVAYDLTILEPRFGTPSFEVTRADGAEGREMVGYRFSEAHRDQWFLRDDRDAIVGNIWDMFVENAKRMRAPGTVRVEPGSERFVMLDGVRMRFKSLSVDVNFVPHHMSSRVSVLDHAIGYQNAVTDEVKIVPLPPAALDLSATKES